MRLGGRLSGLRMLSPRSAAPTSEPLERSPMHKRLWLSIVTLAIGVGLLVAAGFASPASSNSAKPGSKAAKGGTLRIDTRSDYDFVDPALAYYSHSWNIEYASVCKLLNFPDKEATAGGTRVTPE